MTDIKLPPAFRFRYVWPLALFCFISHRILATVTTAIPDMALFANHCSFTKSKCRLFAACKGRAANPTRSIGNGGGKKVYRHFDSDSAWESDFYSIILAFA